jgi:nucleoside phosphorylase
MSPQRSFIDIAILTALPTELEAVRRALGVDTSSRVKAEDGTVYYLADIESSLRQRPYSVVLGCIGQAGNSSAAAAAQAILDRFHPSVLLLMGIAAGVRGKVLIGDVVLSERVVAYEPAALVRTADGHSVQPRPEIERVPHAILQDIVNYRHDRKRIEALFRSMGGQFPKAPEGKEEEYRRHIASGIAVQLATIASGEKLLRDPSKLRDIRRDVHGKVAVGEMEAAGIVEASRRANVPWLVVRGISDFGDELKDDSFHEFASLAAAAVLTDFIQYGLDLGGVPHAPHAPHRSRFIFGRPIDRDQDFVGRTHARDAILQAIDSGQPVQILGEPLMGKTSLLRWVERHVALGRPAVWVNAPQGLSPASLVKEIAKALDKSSLASGLHAESATEAAAAVLEQLLPVTLLFDDADTLAMLGKGFDEAFFVRLRAMVEARRLTWVSASRWDLYDLFSKKGLSSAFLSGARKVRVGLLEEEAAKQLADQMGANCARALALAGRFAYGLQWLGDRLQHDNADVASDAFHTEMETVFARWWAELAIEERQLLRRCAMDEGISRDAVEDRVRRMLRRLVERGLLIEAEGRFRVWGEAWAEFVRNAG